LTGRSGSCALHGVKTEEILAQLFVEELKRVGEQAGLSEVERAHIEAVFRQTLANPSLDEATVYQRLISPEGRKG